MKDNGWDYLLHPSWIIRRRIAEAYMVGVPLVVDVGTYHRQLAVHGQVISIDPLGTLPRSVHQTLGEWYQGVVQQPYGVVCLGMDIEGDDNERAAFKDLLHKSAVAVIETPTEYNPGRTQLQELMSAYPERVETVINLQLPAVQGAAYSRRSLVVFRNGN